MKELTKNELDSREEIIKNMIRNKRNLVKKYGKDAEKVIYGRATNIIRNKKEKMEDNKLKEIVRKALMSPISKNKLEKGKINEKMNQYTFLNIDKAQKIISELTSNIINKYNIGLSDRKKISIILDELSATINEIAVDLENEKSKYGIDENFSPNESEESSMIKGELYQIGKEAIELYKLINSQQKENIDFPVWWQSKITSAKDQISGAKEYLDFQFNEPKLDMDSNIINKSKILNTIDIEEKKLTPAEEKKKEEIVKAMKKHFKGPKGALYAIATAKAEKLK
jgi:hypothetical protein